MLRGRPAASRAGRDIDSRIERRGEIADNHEFLTTRWRMNPSKSGIPASDMPEVSPSQRDPADKRRSVCLSKIHVPFLIFHF